MCAGPAGPKRELSSVGTNSRTRAVLCARGPRTRYFIGFGFVLTQRSRSSDRKLFTVLFCRLLRSSTPHRVPWRLGSSSPR
eukprot:7592830-Pyramimonas_sp.AAC.1